MRHIADDAIIVFPYIYSEGIIRVMKAGVNLERRNTLKTGGSLGLFAVAGQTQPGVASADWLKAASEAMAMDEALDAMGVLIIKTYHNVLDWAIWHGRIEDLSGVSLHGRSGGRRNRVLLTGPSGRYAFRRGGVS